MKKKINIIYLLFMLFLVLLNYITKNSNILNLVLSSSLSILLYNIFSELNIKSTLEKYKNKYKIYKITIIFISLLFIRRCRKIVQAVVIEYFPKADTIAKKSRKNI